MPNRFRRTRGLCLWTYIADDTRHWHSWTALPGRDLVRRGHYGAYLVLARLKPGRFSPDRKVTCPDLCDMALLAVSAVMVLLLQGPGLRAHPHQLSGLAYAFYLVWLCMCALGCLRSFGGRDFRRPATNMTVRNGPVEVVAWYQSQRKHPRSKSTAGASLITCLGSQAYLW